jgi:hypothetical protein
MEQMTASGRTVWHEIKVAMAEFDVSSYSLGRAEGGCTVSSLIPLTDEQIANLRARVPIEVTIEHYGRAGARAA